MKTREQLKMILKASAKNIVRLKKKEAKAKKKLAIYADAVERAKVNLAGVKQDLDTNERAFEDAGVEITMRFYGEVTNG